MKISKICFQIIFFLTMIIYSPNTIEEHESAFSLMSVQKNEDEYNENKKSFIDRHWAFDEKANLVNLNKLNSKYYLFAHHYYCLNCDKELKIEKGCFVHVEDASNCMDDFYLRNVAKEVIYNSFNNCAKYEIRTYSFCEDE